jgi:tetratricopeptide (TPR) repeat protein
VAATRRLTGPFSFELSRLIGRRDYSGAIRYLDDYLLKFPDDVVGRTFLAQCHLWAGSRQSAIDAALTALKLRPNDFDALRLLSEIYAEANEYDQAAAMIRRGLENYPEPTKGISPGVARVLRLILPLLSQRLRSRIEKDLPLLQDPNVTTRRWYSWANEYLRWYDEQTGGRSAPILH